MLLGAEHDHTCAEVLQRSQFESIASRGRRLRTEFPLCLRLQYCDGRVVPSSFVDSSTSEFFLLQNAKTRYPEWETNEEVKSLHLGVLDSVTVSTDFAVLSCLREDDMLFICSRAGDTTHVAFVRFSHRPCSLDNKKQGIKRLMSAECAAPYSSSDLRCVRGALCPQRSDQCPLPFVLGMKYPALGRRNPSPSQPGICTGHSVAAASCLSTAWAVQVVVSPVSSSAVGSATGLCRETAPVRRTIPLSLTSPI